MSTTWWRFLTVVVALLVGRGYAQAQTSVMPIDLGTLGGSGSTPAAVNNFGQVVGQSKLPGDIGVHAFSWTSAGGMIDLGSLWNDSYAVTVTDAGVVVGNSKADADGNWRAFVWTPADGMIDLGSLGGWDQGWESKALTTTPDGDVLGLSWSADDEFTHLFRWNWETGMSDVAVLPLSDEAVIYQVLASVSRIQIVGALGSGPGGTPVGAFLWTSDEGLVDLGELNGFRASVATGVNEWGEISGVITQTTACGGSPHGAYWTRSTGWHITDGGCSSVNWAFAINDPGQIIGNYDNGANRVYIDDIHTGQSNLVTGGFYTHPVDVSQKGQVIGEWTQTDFENAFVWSVAHSLTTLLPADGDQRFSTRVNALNEEGDVVGISKRQDGTVHAVVWHVAPQ